VVSRGPLTDRPLSALGLAENHPGRAEAVRRHAEALGEERLFQRHLHAPLLGQRLEGALGVGDGVDGQRYREPVRRLIASGRRVGAHDDLIGKLQPGVKDLLAERRRNLILRRRVLKTLHHFDTAAAKPRIEFERLFAVAVEPKIEIDLHARLPTGRKSLARRRRRREGVARTPAHKTP